MFTHASYSDSALNGFDKCLSIQEDYQNAIEVRKLILNKVKELKAYCTVQHYG